jgi:DNA-binding transcriptional LysR family regulator
MAINLHLLRIFVAVSQQKSFSAAAKALYISQPAVSKSIQKLEEELDLALFDRSGRNLELTEAGLLLLEYALRLFAIEHGAEDALAQLRGLEHGHLAIGASQTIGTYLLPSLLGEYHQHYPGIRLSLLIGNTLQVVEQLRTSPLDLAFVEGPVTGDDLLISPWRNDQLVVIAPPHHPLIAEQPVTIDRIAGYPYVQREPGSGTREIVEQVFHQHGLELNVSLELGSNEAVKQAVIAGLGISIVSRATVVLETTAGKLMTIDTRDFSLSRRLTKIVVQERPVSRAATAFETLLKEHQFTNP